MGIRVIGRALLALAAVAVVAAPVTAHAASAGEVAPPFVTWTGGSVLTGPFVLYTRNVMTETGTQTPLTGARSFNVGASVSNDGRVVVYGHVSRANWKTGKDVRMIVRVDGHTALDLTGLDSNPTVSADGSVVLFTLVGKGLRIFDVATSRVHVPCTLPDGSSLSETSVSATGEFAVIRPSGSTQLSVIDLSDCSTIVTSPDTLAVTGSVAWNPDSSQIAFRASRHEAKFALVRDGVYVMDMNGRAHISEFKDSIAVTRTRTAVSVQYHSPGWLGGRVYALRMRTVVTMANLLGSMTIQPTTALSWNSSPRTIGEPTLADGQLLDGVLAISGAWSASAPK